jgi:hypothetical protein
MLAPGQLGEALTVRQDGVIQPVGIRLVPRQVQRRKVPTAAGAHDRHHQEGTILADRGAGRSLSTAFGRSLRPAFPIQCWPNGRWEKQRANSNQTGHKIMFNRSASLRSSRSGWKRRCQHWRRFFGGGSGAALLAHAPPPPPSLATGPPADESESPDSPSCDSGSDIASPAWLFASPQTKSNMSPNGAAKDRGRKHKT